MKKLKAMIVAAAAAAAMLITGCDADDTTLLMAANTAGNLGVSAWFAIDDPDDSVKDVLKNVVTMTKTASSTIGAGGSYVEALTPAVQEVIAKHEELNAAQKNLINTGASVVLSSLDTFIASNPVVKENAALASNVVSSFCQGCLTAIQRSGGSAAAKSIKSANRAIKMKYSAKAKAFVEK